MNNFNQSIQRMHRMYKRGGIFVIFAKLLYRYHRIVYSCDIPYRADIDGVVSCHKGFGIVINPFAKIGKGTIIQHGVAIGEISGDHLSPVIGENCYIGAHAMVLGDIRIGNNVEIGAGAVVLSDLPDNCTAVGVPAKVVRK
ncbi:MAG: serine acetyltransferase [Bacteroidaceae bacterium]|nr:serine acetyltransferase [Bacteroidaceae bacterium]